MNMPESRLTDITFNMIVESSPSVVVLVNEQGRIAYLNRQCEALFGYAAHELVGRPIETLLPERFREKHIGLRAGFLAAPTMRSMGVGQNLRARRKDGSEFPVEIGLNPLVLVDGTWVLATVIDISARRQAEERFSKVVQAAPSAMLLVNRKGIITLVNQQVIRLFGYEERELLGQLVDMLVPDSVRPGHPALRESFFATPQTRYMGAGRDLVGRRKDGTQIPIEVGLNPIQTDGELMVLASILDITERKAQQELRAKKEAAEAAYKAKGELLAVASHDLKNPLASIAGLAQIMLEMKKADPQAGEQDVQFLQSIFEASSHMSEVVKGILANEGLEQTGLHVAAESIDLSSLCDELMKFSEPAARRKGISVVCDVTPGIRFHGDRTRLREAFDNYVSNAIKYSPAGKTVTVRLKALPESGQIEFGVQDQGPGLTEDDKQKLFAKFKKLSARPTGGESSTGLGLSIVKMIVEMHGGTVGCDSEHGRGAYFWARLPAK